MTGQTPKIRKMEIRIDGMNISVRKYEPSCPHESRDLREKLLQRIKIALTQHPPSRPQE